MAFYFDKGVDMLHLDANATELGLGFPSLIEALREAFHQDVNVPLRHTHKIKTDGGRDTSLIMPAWSPDGFYGVKIINIYPDNTIRGLPGLHGIYALFDAKTGIPLAFVDADVLTARRTAAAAALAASYLARQDARRLLVVGAGRVARLLPHAMVAVRPIEKVAIWSRTAESASRLASELVAAGLAAEAISDLEVGARNADIITCATLSETPLIRGEWLRAGTHLDLIGSFSPSMREADAECFRRASVFIDTAEAAAKSGDLLSAMQEGGLTQGCIVATLQNLAHGGHPGRSTADEITVFKAVGTALEDLAAARLAYRSFVSLSTTSTELSP
jgi:ornithine cyclodeaminase